MKRNQPVESLQLVRTFPPDGSYPPRIVFQNNSVWLSAYSEPIELVDGVFAQNTGDRCVIYQAHDKAAIRVNDQIIVGRRVLKDGDFIHNKKIRAIFQADPVADFRAEWAAEGLDTQIEIQPTVRLLKNIVMNAEGMSLNAGVNFARWLEISTLLLYWEHSSGNWGIQIGTIKAGSYTEVLPSKFRASVLGADEIDTILQWLYYLAPVKLSIQAFSLSEFPDAYTALAQKLVFTPFQQIRQDLPVSPAFILGLATRREAVKRILLQILLNTFVSFILAIVINEAFKFPLAYAFLAVFILGLLFQFKAYREVIVFLRQLPHYEGSD